MYYGRFNLLQLCRPVSGYGPLVAAGNFRSFWLPLLLLLLPHHLYQYTPTAVCLARGQSNQLGMDWATGSVVGQEETRGSDVVTAWRPQFDCDK